MSGPAGSRLDPALAAEATDALAALLRMLRLHTETASHAGTRALRAWEGGYADQFRGSQAAARGEAAELQDQIVSLIAEVAAASSGGQA